MRWVAELNNKATVMELPPVPGEKTSWQHLLDILEETGVEIMTLRLEGDDFKITSIPMCDGYFQAGETFRSFLENKERHWRGIGSVIRDKVYITWVELDEPGFTEEKVRIHQEVRELETCRIHTTLR